MSILHHLEDLAIEYDFIDRHRRGLASGGHFNQMKKNCVRQTTAFVSVYSI